MPNCDNSVPQVNSLKLYIKQEKKYQIKSSVA